MARQRPNPRDSLAHNLALLMKARDWSQAELAKRAHVDQKTISNIVNHANAPTLDKLDRIAAAFGLNAWQLILPNLPNELVNNGTIERLFENFVASDTKGRDYINHVAEREAQYNVND